MPGKMHYFTCVCAQPSVQVKLVWGQAYVAKNIASE